MKHDEYLGFAAIRDDDEFLDRIARRESLDDDGLGELFAAWTREIDLDAAESADRVGPWKLRGEVATQADSQRPVRTVRIQGSRAAAVVGAIVITLSGGSVAAALSSGAGPIANFIPRSTPTVPDVAGSAQSDLGNLTRGVIQDKLNRREYAQARALVNELKVNAAGNQAALADVGELSQLIDQAEATQGVVSPTGIPTLPTTVVSVPPTSGPTLPAPGTGGPTSTSTSEPSSSGSSTSTPSTTPSTPAPGTPTSPSSPSGSTHPSSPSSGSPSSPASPTPKPSTGGSGQPTSTSEPTSSAGSPSTAAPSASAASGDDAGAGSSGGERELPPTNLTPVSD